MSESLNIEGNQIGIEGSVKIIEQNYNSDLSKQLTSVTQDVIKSSGDKKLSDDLTIIAIGK